MLYDVPQDEPVSRPGAWVEEAITILVELARHATRASSESMSSWIVSGNDNCLVDINDRKSNRLRVSPDQTTTMPIQSSVDLRQCTNKHIELGYMYGIRINYVFAPPCRRSARGGIFDLCPVKKTPSDAT